MLSVLLRPEIGDELLATHAVRARDGEHREERESPALGRAAGEGARRRLYRGTAEQLQEKHVSGEREARLRRERVDASPT